jgi:subtilisin family serine protease
VTFAPGTSAAAQLDALAAAGATSLGSIPVLRIHSIEATASAFADLLQNPLVTRLDADRVRETEADPSDAAYPDQWALPKIGWSAIWETYTATGTSVVAVLDTGVDASHPDLAGQLVAGTSILDGSDGTTDSNGHGTAMAGIIAAIANNGDGIAGLGLGAVKVMPVTVLNPDGEGQDFDIISGIVWAVDNGADVINMSFSNPGYSAALQAAIDYAWANDVVLVAAAGNDGTSSPAFPAGGRALGVVQLRPERLPCRPRGGHLHHHPGRRHHLDHGYLGVVRDCRGGGRSSPSGGSVGFERQRCNAPRPKRRFCRHRRANWQWPAQRRASWNIDGNR